MSDIEIEGLRKSFAGTAVLQDLHLSIRSGSIVAVLGSSGSGKSTLLRCIAGLLRPDAGSIRLGGKPMVGPGVWVTPERRRVGLVPQEGSLFPHLSVAGNVGFGLRSAGRSQRVDELLELVGLPGTGSMRPHELSGGMQQRVAVARALAPQPEVVLLDEPFSALDAGLRDEVRSDVFAALRATSATAVLVTHDQEEAFAVADEVAVMMAGAIPQVAPPAEMYQQPATLEIARFLGDTVLVAGAADGGGVATAVGTVAVSGHWSPGTQGLVVLRPEDLRVDGVGHPLTQAIVTSVRYHGHDALLTTQAGDVQLMIRVLGRPAFTIGDAVQVSTVREAAFFPDEGLDRGRPGAPRTLDPQTRPPV